MEREDNFKNYIDLYEKGIPIAQLSPLNNQTYKVFRNSGVDIRVLDRDKNYKTLAGCTKLNHFTLDTKKESHRFFYIIPIQSPNGTYVGFIYRTLFGKSYASIYRPFTSKIKKVPYMFGFYNDFKNYNRHTTCMPIVVCEGVKDALTLKRFYPYVLSTNTSSLGIGKYILANITNRIILAYDNDPTGIESVRKDKKALNNLGITVDVLKYDEGFKDMADYIDHPQEMNKIRDQLKRRVKGLIDGVSVLV